MTVLILYLLILSTTIFQGDAFQPGRVSSASFESKTDDHDHDYKYTVTADCKDRLSTLRCAREVQGRLECNDLLRNFCPKTCHACHLKAPSPPKNVDCKRTRFGCCWDGKTPQQNYAGEGCPECQDDPLLAGLCQRWAVHCNNRTFYEEHQIVNKRCHKTCKKCFARQKTNILKAVRTLPPIIEDENTSENEPRRGAVYVWTKLLTPGEYDQEIFKRNQRRRNHQRYRWEFGR